MSRSARGDQSAFSLFPFLAVLLCTMGALVVLLVAMAHVSRGKAKQEALAAAAVAEQARLAVDSPERRAMEARVAEAQAAVEELHRLKQAGADRLASEQKRLSDIEDHLRRLREETEALVVETSEQFAIEEEHYDDAKVAEQELERLNALIGEIQDDIEKLKFAAAGRERKYAVVPLRDARTGTLRPPVYFECLETGVVLQPEGVTLTWQDLVAGDFSSPMSAASRAVSRYYEEHPEVRAANEIGMPYPLLVVRPGGVHAYYLARSALETAGVDYGYQPVAEEWPIEYGETNPVLAQLVDDAVRTARAEREGLARMIPPLAGALATAERDARYAMSASGVGASGAVPVETGAGGAGRSGGSLRVRHADPDANNPFEGLRIEGSLAGASVVPGAPSDDPTDNATPSAQGTEGPSLGLAAPLSPGGGAQGTAAPGPQGVAAAAGNEAESAKAEGDPKTLGQRYGAVGGQAASAGSPPPAGAPTDNALAKDDSQGDRPTPSVVANTGAPSRGDPSMNQGQQAPTRDGVPMVRPIRLYVSHDRAVVLPDQAQSADAMVRASSTSQAIRFDGATTDNINDLIGALKRHADSWGIAGSGMYWDPRLVLNVASDGSQRADDVRRLLQAAGIKVQAYPVTTAAKPESVGGADATRR